MSLKLDKRIKTITDIQSVTFGCNDWELHTKGYFANRIADFKDLSKCMYGKYVEYRYDDKCFLCEVDLSDGTSDRDWYTYFISEDTLNPIEKKYRPFTNEEFFNLFDAGKLHSIRKKNERGRFIITEVYFNDDCEKDKVYVKLNHCSAGFAMRYLVNNGYEYFDDREWQPFGVIDE